MPKVEKLFSTSYDVRVGPPYTHEHVNVHSQGCKNKCKGMGLGDGSVGKVYAKHS